MQIAFVAMFISRKRQCNGKNFNGLADIVVDLEKNEDDIEMLFCQFSFFKELADS